MRPVVIVSSNAANDSANRRGRGVVTVVPVTTNVRFVYPFQVLLPTEDSGLPVPSKAQAEQVRSISTDRLIRVVSTLSTRLVLEIDDALRLHLSL
ncbi:MAG: type II toxin-antitoxin system PemK/MazF family toxin [Homoserinimonas sp.]|nr:type II toxin-antitoxin system PemK/MazF family toxin [Homoserinimonas sp.]